MITTLSSRQLSSRQVLELYQAIVDINNIIDVISNETQKKDFIKTRNDLFNELKGHVISNNDFEIGIVTGCIVSFMGFSLWFKFLRN